MNSIKLRVRCCSVLQGVDSLKNIVLVLALFLAIVRRWSVAMCVSLVTGVNFCMFQVTRVLFSIRHEIFRFFLCSGAYWVVAWLCVALHLRFLRCFTLFSEYYIYY